MPLQLGNASLYPILVATTPKPSRMPSQTDVLQPRNTTSIQNELFVAVSKDAGVLIPNNKPAKKTEQSTLFLTEWLSESLYIPLTRRLLTPLPSPLSAALLRTPRFRTSCSGTDTGLMRVPTEIRCLLSPPHKNVYYLTGYSVWVVWRGG